MLQFDEVSNTGNIDLNLQAEVMMNHTITSKFTCLHTWHENRPSQYNVVHILVHHYA